MDEPALPVHRLYQVEDQRRVQGQEPAPGGGQIQPQNDRNRLVAQVRQSPTDTLRLHEHVLLVRGRPGGNLSVEHDHLEPHSAG